MTIVEDQDFVHGRDATITPAHNVYQQVPDDAPVLPADKVRARDFRLEWRSPS